MSVSRDCPRLNFIQVGRCIIQTLPALEELRPGVLLLESRLEIPEIEFCRIERGLDLAPGKRCGNRRVRFAANGIGAHHRLHFAVAEWVEIYAVASRRDQSFSR